MLHMCAGSHFGFLKKWKKFQNFGDLNLGLQRGSPLPYPQDHESWIIHRLYFICLIQIPKFLKIHNGRPCTCGACRAIKIVHYLFFSLSPTRSGKRVQFFIRSETVWCRYLGIKYFFPIIVYQSISSWKNRLAIV